MNIAELCVIVDAAVKTLSVSVDKGNSDCVSVNAVRETLCQHGCYRGNSDRVSVDAAMETLTVSTWMLQGKQ